jgi:putative ABC transport system permease protein
MTILRDLRFAARMTTRHPGFATICVLTLGVGIALTATMFSVIHTLMLRPLPFEDADRLAFVSHTNVTQGSEGMAIPLPDLEAYRQEHQAFEGLASYRLGTFNVGGGDFPERYDGAWVSANLFDLLRARPLLGRTFQPGEDAAGAERVTVIGFRLWQDRFGGDPGVVGETLRINGEMATVVGVMEEGFMFPYRQAAWVPDREADGAERGATGVPSANVFGRLRPGVTVGQANAQLEAISGRLAAAYPETNENLRARVVPLADRFRGLALSGEVRQILFTMLGAVFLVLLIACLNVANLLLGRTVMRSREVAIRSAMGASRLRIVAQFLTEPLILATGGAALGLGLAALGAALIGGSIPASNAFYWHDFGVDRTVLLFVIGLMVFATLVSGLLPALRAADGSVSETLKDESRGTSSGRIGRLTRALVVAQVALAVVILTSAGLMIRTTVNIINEDHPFPTTDIFTARLGFPLEYPAYTEVAERIRFFEEVEARVAALPGVRAAAMTSAPPGLWAGSTAYSVEGQSDDRPVWTRWAAVTPAFFDVFEVRMMEGRPFDLHDRADGLPVAIVNEGFARLRFPDGNAVGSRIRMGGAASDAEWRTIVGVVPDLGMTGGQDWGDDRDGFYFPLAQATGARFMTIVARTTGPPTAITPQVRDAVAAVDRDIPIYWAQSLRDAMLENVWDVRTIGTIFMAMGLVALFLAAIGLYGVIAFSVSRRTREMGVRMALGADPARVLRMVLRQGGRQLAIGLAVGLVGALAVARVLSSFLYGVGTHDPATFAAITVVLLLAGLLAIWLPARRATRVDPLIAIRSD